jgi:hypothetical protein
MERDYHLINSCMLSHNVAEEKWEAQAERSSVDFGFREINTMILIRLIIRDISKKVQNISTILLGFTDRTIGQDASLRATRLAISAWNGCHRPGVQAKPRIWQGKLNLNFPDPFDHIASATSF